MAATPGVEKLQLQIEATGINPVVDALQKLGMSADQAYARWEEGARKVAASSQEGQLRMQMFTAAMKSGDAQGKQLADALKYLNEQELRTVDSAARAAGLYGTQAKAANDAAAAVKKLGNEKKATTAAGDGLAKSIDKTNAAMNKFSSAFNVIAGFLASSFLVKAIDSYTQMETKLRNVASASDQVGNSLAKIYQIDGTARGATFSGLFEDLGTTEEKLTSTKAGIISVGDAAQEAGDKAARAGDGFKTLTGNGTLPNAIQGVTFSIVGMNHEAEIAKLRAEDLAKSQSFAADEMKKLTSISLATGTNLATNVTLFANLTNGAAKYGFTADQLTKTVETLGFAMRGAASGGEPAKRAIQQLTDGINAGKLAGQDLKLMLTAVPQLGRVFETELGIASGSLRKWAETNDLSAKVIVNALLHQRDAIMQLGKDAPLTIGAALENLSTRFTVWIGQMNEATGASGKIVTAITFLGDHLDQIMPVLQAFGVAWAAIKFAEIGVAIFNIVTSMNPWILAIKVAVVAISLLIEYMGGIGPAWEKVQAIWNAGIEFLHNSWSAIVADWQRGLDQWNALWEGAVHVWDAFKQAAVDAFNYIYDAALGWAGRMLDKIASVIQAAKDAWAAVSGGANAPGASDMQPGFRTGGSFTVGGAGAGVDSQLVSFMASPGERVIVQTPAQQAGHQSVPHFRDGGAMYVSAGTTSVTGYDAPQSPASIGLPTSRPSNDNTDIAAQIANSLSIYSQVPLLFARTIDALSYMKHDPAATAFTGGDEQNRLSRGFGVRMVYAGMSPADIRGGALWSEVEGGPQTSFDKTKTEAMFSENDYRPFARFPGGREGASRQLTDGVAAGAIDWNGSKIDFERKLNDGFYRTENGQTNPNLGFARDGLDLVVPGGGGVDSRLLNLAVSPGERVRVTTPQQEQQEMSGGRRGGTIVVNAPITVTTPDPDSFRRSKTQLAQELNTKLQRISARGG